VKNGERYTAEELDARLRFIGGLVLFAVFGFAMLSILYDLIFVEQPMVGMAPADKALVEILKMMVAFLAGVLTRVFDKSPSITPYQLPSCPPSAPNPISSPINLQLRKPDLPVKQNERPEL